MSLILFSGSGGTVADLHCERCGSWVGVEEMSVISDMVLRGVRVLCFDCDKLSDRIPSHIYFNDDTFLLGLGDLSFLASWRVPDTLRPAQDDLVLTRITQGAWYSLRTGDVRLLSVPPLSSSPKVIILDVEGWGQSE